MNFTREELIALEYTLNMDIIRLSNTQRKTGQKIERIDILKSIIEKVRKI